MALGLWTVMRAGEGVASTQRKAPLPAALPRTKMQAKAERDPKRAPPAGPLALDRDQGLR